MLKDLALKLIFAALMMFKNTIAKAEEKSPVLVKILDWLKQITADLQAYAEGKPLPTISTGIPYIDAFINILADFIASDVKAPANLAVVLDEISTNVMAVLTEIDPAAAEAYKAPAPDPKADLKTQGTQAVDRASGSVASLATIAESLKDKDGNVANTIKYHLEQIKTAFESVKGLIAKW